MKALTSTNKLFIAAIILVYFFLIAFSVIIRYEPYLNFDEAGQFWMAKGLNHDSHPLAPTGSLSDVIENNQDYNFDPGGFSIILHFWSTISNHYLWLRALPFIFFLLANVSLTCIAYDWTKNKWLAIITGMSFFIFPIMYEEAFNLRAYSMEILGVLACIIIVRGLEKSITARRLLISALIISFFMTSRYSFTILAFTVSTYILYLIFKTSASYKWKFLNLTLYAVPLFIVLTYNYFFALRFQNPELTSLFYIPYLKDNPLTLFRGDSLLFIFSIVLIVWYIFLSRRTQTAKKHFGLFYITIATSIIFFILSCLGIYPWLGGQGTTRCITIVTLSIVSVLAISLDITSSKLLSYDMNRYLLLFLVCVLFVNNNESAVKSYFHNNTASQYKLISRHDGKVYVDSNEAPCMRYQFEFGILKDDPTYPLRFTFEYGGKHRLGGKAPVNSDKLNASQVDLSDYSILIVPPHKLNNYKIHEKGDRWQLADDNERDWDLTDGKGYVWIKTSTSTINQ